MPDLVVDLICSINRPSTTKEKTLVIEIGLCQTHSAPRYVYVLNVMEVSGYK